jgi:hypothetical protein
LCSVFHKILFGDRSSESFTNDSIIVRKALRNTTLAHALNYYAEEIIDHDRPLYGIYKALEQISTHLGKGSKGRGALATLAGKPRKFVDDIMETAQTERHSEQWLALKKTKVLLTDQECIERAQLLIKVYADSLP